MKLIEAIPRVPEMLTQHIHSAIVVNVELKILVNINESTYFSTGYKHRVVNPGVVGLAMIEVQSGEYLGEDDIVLFEEKYGRVTQ